MNLRQIEVFRAVMTTGSVTQAARLLHVSQPGVSRLIRHLEIQLGVTLFERRNARLVPTPEARTLQAEVDKVYRGVRHVQNVAAGLRLGDRGTLRVVASANTGLQLVPRAAAQLLERHPHVKVFFESLPTREIVQTLLAEEADLAVTSAPPDHPALEVREIGHWTLRCVVARGHPLLDAPFELASALRHRLVAYSPEAPQSRVIDDWIEAFGIARQVAVEVRSGYAACAMAASGAGVAFVDDLSVRAHRDEQLVSLPIPDAPRFGIFGVHNTSRPPSQLAQAFLERVVAQLGQPGV